MRAVTLRPGADLDGFRAAARALAAQAVPPNAVAWTIESEPGLFGATEGAGPSAPSARFTSPERRGRERSERVRGVPSPESSLPSPGPSGRPLPLGEVGAAPAPLLLPRAVGALVESVVCYRDPERYALLYHLIWRVLHGERALLEVASDPLVHRLQRMAKVVKRDEHKMHAFVRFRRVAGEPEERFVAWFEPEHFVVERAAPFFARRFPSFSWSILTPIGSIDWDTREVSFGPPAARGDAPAHDAFETGWRG